MSRWKVAYTSWVLDLTVGRLTREEDRALEQAGKDFHAALAGRGRPLAEPVATALARVIALEQQGRSLDERLTASLENDRRDYRASRSALGRSLIVARGVLERLVLREEARRARRDLPECLGELGARVVADPPRSCC